MDHTSGPIHPDLQVSEIRTLPEGAQHQAPVQHLPPDVAEFYANADRVLTAGVPSAAAVELRKTLEAAAAHKGIDEKPLYKAVEKLIEQGFVTKDFGGLLTHVRQIGNAGAHFTEAAPDLAQVQRSMRYTTQILRNLFEVPGELSELKAETDAARAQAEAESEAE